MINKRTIILFLTILSASATGLMHAEFNINDPKNFAWPYNIVVAVKNWFSSTPINLTPKPRLRTRISTAIKSCFYKFYKPSPENEQLKNKQLINQAQSLLDQHLALVSKISNTTAAEALCSPISLFWCKLIYGYTSNLNQIKQLLRDAGLKSVGTMQIGQELYEQSRVLVNQSKPRALIRVLFPQQFDLNKLIARTHAINNTTSPVTFETYW